ncbi:MAG: restriction endonuclease subunit S [Hahellaceae bacterium]|nr:restriction endonuclease subunit S [Hahellaceae bacterium]
MGSDWPEVALGSVTTWLSGGTPNKATPSFWNGNIPWISANSMYGTRFNDSDLRITESGLDAGSRLAPTNSVLLLVRGGALHNRLPVGMACRDLAFNQDVKALITDPAKLDPWFLLYWLIGNERFLLDVVVEETGIGAGKLDTKRMQALPIRLPPMALQQRITQVAQSIDNKIDLNRRINQTLEAMAQAIFKSWFVDFDPVKAKIAAKQEGRDVLRTAMSAISGKSETELDALPPEQYEQLATTAALFPDEMEELELGGIPKGWAFNSVGDVAKFANEKVDVSALNEDIYISTENMLENRAGVTRATSIPSVAAVPSFKTGQILVSNIRPYFKKIWMARFDGGRSPDVLAFEPEVPQSSEFLYNLMYQDAFFEFMTRTAKGAKMPRGDKDAIMGWKFPCPDEVLMTCFSEKVRPNYTYIESLISENRSLIELRDTLLPKLLSGELSVHAVAEHAGAQ